MKEAAFPFSVFSRDHDESTMTEARALLARAVARIDELSDIDRERVSYLERRSTDREQQTQDTREAAEDLFHTANNALFIVTVNLSLLTAYLARETCAPEAARWLRIMGEKLDEVALVNRRLLAANAGGTGPLYLVHSYISFRSIVQRALDVYEDVAREKDIRISWEVPAYPAIMVWTDGVAVGTVLDNLLSNAIKFSQPGTGITVSMRREGKELICTVRDEGPGMNDEDVALLFRRGAQLEPRPTGGESSSGCGLAVAYDVVESLGGRIWCESKKGEGTSFMFALPTDVETPSS
jgi:signal transduction histidine kinase